MNKNFTPEDIEKKHETNIKSATSGFMLAGVLGIIYIVRFFITNNFDFYFSLTFTELMLRLGDAEKIPPVSSYVLAAVFVTAYLLVAVMTAKKSKSLVVALCLYCFDFVCFVPLFAFRGSLQPEFFIDVIVHLFVLIFLAVGIKSSRRPKGE